MLISYPPYVQNLGEEILGMRLGVIAMAGLHTGGGGENDVLIN